ncbi:beta-1,3-glucan-binding protein-like [Ylistrum balloti]|uniref:beta-1,3-glucan-binding protein-like n=1 Tax=Ylistrum balloti TaxID=509963 RepID=UPI00290599E0|nr:beta-1,3-glucan-binding protein-like [Ylistrum balloti]
MKLLGVCLVFAILNAALCIQQAKITSLQPHGIRFEIPDEGFSFVGLHYSVNKPVAGVAAGDINVDIRSKIGDNFVYEHTTEDLHPGDTINYWVLGLKNGRGEQLTGLSYTIPAPTPKPTTRPPTTTTTTLKPTPAVSGTDLHSSGTGSGSSTGGSFSTDTSSGISKHDLDYINSLSGQTGSGTNTGTSGVQNTGSAGTGSSTGQGTTSGTGGCSCQFAGSGSGRAIPNCQSYPCLIFEDNFDTLDMDTWEHEITASGGGNWEFQYYLNNRSNSYVKDGVLYIKPTLTTDRFGPDFLTTGTLDLWGGTPGDTCTSNQFYGCKRVGNGAHPINPIQSAKLRSSRGFNFKYGKIEIEAKMPLGDWIWPAIWMLPLRNAYGQWPASGEIDIVESRGNRHYTASDGTHKGADSFGSTLHFGPSILDKSYDPWQTAHVEKTLPQGTLADDFHKYGVEWTEDHIKFLFDDQETLTVTPPAQGGFWKHGNLDKSGFENPYRNASKIAPFDQQFYLIMNVAVGGVGFFDDKLINSPTPKPWRDDNEFTTRDFINAKTQWYPTWNPTDRNGEDAAMKVNYVKVWKLSP